MFGIGEVQMFACPAFSLCRSDIPCGTSCKWHWDVLCISPGGDWGS